MVCLILAKGRCIFGLGTNLESWSRCCIGSCKKITGMDFTSLLVNVGDIFDDSKVIRVDRGSGLLLEIPSVPIPTLAYVNVSDLSDKEVRKWEKSFKEGSLHHVRVFGFRLLEGLATGVLKVKSKLPVLSSFTDATEGLWTHGWIVKIENHACFVRFYNGVQGYAPRSELGLDPGSEVSSMYHVEQVVKCRVTISVPTTRRINLSFLVTPTRTFEDEDVKLGSIVSGTVEKVTENFVSINVGVKDYIRGIIYSEHLADNHGIVSTMMELLKPRYKFVKLLVLDVENNNLILTAKYSLVNAAQHLPADASQVYPNSIVPGYICNIIDTGCFVRFIGRLTGFAPKNRAVDDHMAGLSGIR